MSSASPSSQAWNPGAASRLFSFIANANLSFDGKKESTSITPILGTGGAWMAWISAAKSRSSSFFHVWSRMVEMRMCSRLWIGSASTPSNPSKLVTVVLIRSRSSSASSRTSADGAAKDFRMETGSPALLPGV